MIHQNISYLVGVLGFLVICPVLFLSKEENNDNDDARSSESYQAIDTNSFSYSVMATLGYAIPLTVDVLMIYGEQRMTKATNKKAYNPLLDMTMVCATLLVTSALHLNYSVWHPNVRATWSILNIRLVLLGCLVIQQMQLRFKHTLSARWWYGLMVVWVPLTVLRAYITVETSFVGILTTVIRVAALCALVTYSQLTHLRLAWQHRLDNTSDIMSTRGINSKWQSTEVPAAVANLLFIGLYVWHEIEAIRVGSIYAKGIFLWSGFNYGSTSALVFLSLCFNHEYRVDCAKAEDKLIIKQQFVQHASHEVRNALNACTLGLKYVKSMIPSGDDDIICNTDDQCTIHTARYAWLNQMEAALSDTEESCATAMEFMNNLLLYEKIDSMELSLFFAHERVDRICRKVVRSFALSAKQLRISLKFRTVFENNSTKSLSTGAAAATAGGNDNDSSIIKTDGRSGNATAPSMLVSVDVSKISVMLRNLLSNALKFTPDGGSIIVTVTPVDLSSSVAAGTSDLAILPAASAENVTHYRVAVSDTGRGLTKGQQDDLFGRFVQFSPNKNQQGGGSGIGLYLSQHIARSHGCSLNVHSEGIKGKGTMFYFDLVAQDNSSSRKSSDGSTSPSKSNRQRQQQQKVHATASVDESSPVVAVTSIPSSCSKDSYNRDLSSPRHNKPDKSGLSILIVDDSRMNRKMLRRSLTQHRIGRVVEEAEDGLELLTAVGLPVEVDSQEDGRGGGSNPSASVTPCNISKTYHLIVVDDAMPRMTGSVAVSTLRKNGYDGLVVGLSGNATEEDMNAFCEAGADYTLPKPIDMDRLIEIIDNHELLL